MTLLVGTVARSRKPHIVLTADGRCTKFDGVSRSISSDSYQKIFPIPDAPAAIAHHGENILSGTPVMDFLESFVCEQKDVSLMEMDQLEEALLSHTDRHAKETLCTIQTSKQLGFWIAGFGHGRNEPKLLEVCWSKNTVTGEVATERNEHGNLVFGGDAQRFVNKYCKQPVDGMYSFERLPKENLKYAVKFHAKLYRLAESVQANENEELFGGHKHQVQITPDGWRWTIPPPGPESSDTNERP